MPKLLVYHNSAFSDILLFLPYLWYRFKDKNPVFKNSKVETHLYEPRYEEKLEGARAVR